MCRQIIGIVVITVSQSFSYSLPDNLLAINQCTSKSPALNDTSMPKCFYLPNNQSVPIVFKDSVPLNDPAPTILFCLSLTVFTFLILVFLFWPKYRRLESERLNSLEKSVAYAWRVKVLPFYFFMFCATTPQVCPLLLPPFLFPVSIQVLYLLLIL